MSREHRSDRRVGERREAEEDADFDALIDQIEREAAEDGPKAVLQLRALQAKYRILSFITEARRARHFTQRELAERVGMTQAQLSKIERGRKSPTLDTLSRIVAALGVEFPSPRILELSTEASLAPAAAIVMVEDDSHTDVAHEGGVSSAWDAKPAETAKLVKE